MKNAIVLCIETLRRSGLDEIAKEADAELAALENDNRELLDALKWAWDNLQYEEPYPDDEAEYGRCIVCGNRDFDHKKNCEALTHKKAANALLAKHGRLE